MGRPSDKRRRAQRLGKRERARAKKRFRGETGCSVVGAGTFRVHAGRTKYRKVYAYVHRLVDTHLGGDSLTAKSGISIKRPTYTVEMSPTHNYGSPWEWPTSETIR